MSAKPVVSLSALYIRENKLSFEGDNDLDILSKGKGAGPHCVGCADALTTFCVVELIYDSLDLGRKRTTRAK